MSAISGLFKAFRARHAATPAPAGPRVDPVIVQSATPVAAPSYAPVDPGLTAATVDDMLAAHEPLIAKIKLCYGADRPTFERDILRLVRSYAAFVNVLPATAENYFAEPSGLFRLGLEAAFFSLQGTDGHIVAGRSTISTRRELEPRWRQATFIAGLCSELHRTLSHITVTDHDGVEWPPYLGPLTGWLESQRASQFFVRWIPNAPDARTMGLFALHHVIPAEVLQYLAAGNTTVVPHLFASISGMPIHRDQNVLDDLVRRACALVIDRNLVASASRYGKPILGAHLERYLIDAMRRLVGSDPAWSVNQEKSRVWFSGDGMFVIWPNAAADLKKLFDEDQFPGIPRSPETILEILMGAGVVEPTPHGAALWRIRPPTAKAPIEAVKLCSPAILLATLQDAPVPIAASLLAPPAGAEPVAAPSKADHQKPAQAANAPHHAGDALADRKASATEQLPLALETGGTTQAPATVQPARTEHLAAPGPERGSVETQFSLVAPMRLAPAVRDALASAIASLNDDAKAASACTVPAGVFVPLSVFERRQIHPSAALRNLFEAGMLAGSEKRATTVQHDFGGQRELGVVVDVKYVKGLSPADFLTAS